ncbi:MAG TPA: DUF2600 family protein [Solirubrobacteraceae bacterium]|nr:DUF2600 family protein [Solirubrobacteraceae bacterium]
MSAGQLSALFRAASRELLWGLRAAATEIQGWRRRAEAIPDAAIRADALYVLEHKRTHIHGAALFWTLPRTRNLQLLRLLVAYELVWDFLDNLSESAAAQGWIDGRALHMAIPEAIDPSAPISDYYSQHPWQEDGGYLRSIVQACRTRCEHLPSYPRVRELALREAHRAQVLALNHWPDQHDRDRALERWVAAAYPQDHRASWWELSGAASTPLTIHALLALAAEPVCTEQDILRTRAAYFPWLAATTTMLDSYVDQPEDDRNGDHSYIAHYPDREQAIEAVRALLARSLTEALCLSNGHRHAVIAASMAAMYLSKPTAHSHALQPDTRAVISAGGTLTRVLLPILRLWRIAFAQRQA